MNQQAQFDLEGAETQTRERIEREVMPYAQAA
jgi:hypothetical protein